MKQIKIHDEDWQILFLRKIRLNKATIAEVVSDMIKKETVKETSKKKAKE